MASIYDLLNLDADERIDRELAQMTPFERSVAQERQFERAAVRGVEDIGRAALGIGPSQQQNREAAGRELRELAVKMRPGTPEFYTAAAAIFQKYGLVAEAEKMQKELHTLEIGKAELDPVLKMQRAYDDLNKRFTAGDKSVEPAMKTLLRNIQEARTKGTGANDPEFLKLLNAYEAATEAGQGDRAEIIKKALDAWIKNKEQSGDAVAWARLALAQTIEKRVAGDKTESSNRAIASIVSALQGSVRALDEEINAASRLLVHPGRPGIVGTIYGALPIGVLAAKNDASAGAAALYRTLEGQTFIRALQDLKATSKTGASGLGQLTEVEGNKIQQAKTSIHRQQPDDQFVRTLKAYIAVLQKARDAGAGELGKAKADVPTAPAPVVDTLSRADPRAVVAPPAKRTFKSTVVTP